MVGLRGDVPTRRLARTARGHRTFNRVAFERSKHDGALGSRPFFDANLGFPWVVTRHPVLSTLAVIRGQCVFRSSTRNATFSTPADRTPINTSRIRPNLARASALM